MKYLVTGATGFIGSKLCEKLLSLGNEVIGIGRNKIPENKIDSNPSFTFIKRDLSCEKITPEELKDVDILLHLAGSVLGAEKSEEAYLKNNEITAVNVFESCFKYVNRVVYASSQVVYGDPNSLAVDEKFPLNGYDTPYACSKLNIENWLRWYQKKHNTCVICLRFTGFVEDPGSAISYFLDKAVKGETLELYSKGEIHRDYLALNDGVNAMILSSRSDFSPGFYEYNIGSGDALKMRDIVDFICNRTHSSSIVVPLEMRAPRLNFVYNIGKAGQELLFTPLTLKEAIREYINLKIHSERI